MDASKAETKKHRFTQRKYVFVDLLLVGLLLVAGPLALSYTVGITNAYQNYDGGLYVGNIIQSYACNQNTGTIWAETNYCVEVFVNQTLFYGQLTCNVYPVDSNVLMEYYPHMTSTYQYRFMNLPYGCSQQPPLP